MEGKNISQTGTMRQTEYQQDMINSLKRTQTEMVPVKVEKYLKSGSQKIFFYYQNGGKSSNRRPDGELEGADTER